MAKRNSASESVDKLSRGLSRDTPQRRAEDERTHEASAKEQTPASPSGNTAAKASPDDRKVRVSVDLPRYRHKYLKDFAYDAETDAMSVMKALLEELNEDPELEEKILNRLGSQR